jgi:hypothetical protein
LNQSRKTKSRGRIRRERQLRQQRERIKTCVEEKFIPKEFSLGMYLKRQRGLIVLLLVLVVGIRGIRRLGPDKKADTAIEASVGSQLAERSQVWPKEYPYGYKIIALTEKEIFHTSYDTFSDDFKIDWRDLSVTRIKADHLKKTEEKIRIVAPQVRYVPHNISSRSEVTVTISRKKGMKTSLLKFDHFELFTEIVEDHEGYLFCLFGLKDI